MRYDLGRIQHRGVGDVSAHPGDLWKPRYSTVEGTLVHEVQAKLQEAVLTDLSGLQPISTVINKFLFANVQP